MKLGGQGRGNRFRDSWIQRDQNMNEILKELIKMPLKN